MATVQDIKDTAEGDSSEFSDTLEVDDSLDDLSDASSLHSAHSSDSETVSLVEAAFNFPWEHGRRYHSSWGDRKYAFPNDDRELDRLDWLNMILQMVIGDKLFCAPLNMEKIHRVLDVCTGTGIWAFEVGEAYPHLQVIGTDISPVQPNFVPLNVRYEIDDVEQQWNYRQPFDFIFCRQLMFAIHDWPNLVKNVYNHLSPGGWCEFQDYDNIPTSDDGTVREDDDFVRWERLLIKASERMGTEPSPGPRLEQWVREAGFVNVTHRRFKVPIGRWPNDPRMKKIGYFVYANLLDGLEGFSFRLLCQGLGWSEGQVVELLAKVRATIRSTRRWHGYFYYHVVYAQKPGQPSAAAAAAAEDSGVSVAGSA